MTQQPHLRPALTLAALMLLGLGSGCSKVGEKAAEAAMEKGMERSLEQAGHPGQHVDVSDGGQAIRMQGQDGTTVELNEHGVSLPSHFPTDIYVPKPSQLNASTSTGDGQFMLNGKSSTAFRVEEIRTAMQGQGWKEEMTSQQPDVTLISFAKGPRKVLYTLSKTAEQAYEFSLVATKEG